MFIQKRILYFLLPGLIPLLVFTIIEAFFGTTTGILTAIAVGIVLLFISYLVSDRFELFILTDISLLIILGGLSLITGKPIFFLLKPAFIELLFVTMPLLVNQHEKNMLYGMARRIFGDSQISSGNPWKINRPVKAVIFIGFLHALLVIYAALNLSILAWGIISFVMFPLIPGIYFAYELFRLKTTHSNSAKTEFVPLVDENGRVFGRAKREEVHFNPAGKLLHPVVHLHVFNKEQQLFLQKRPEWKEVQPGKWDTAVGGHLSYGDTIEKGLRREAMEELGISRFKPVLLSRYLWETEVEKELVYMFYTLTDEIPVINTEELSDGRFWSLQEISENINNDLFTPNFIQEFGILESSLLKNNPDRIS